MAEPQAIPNNFYKFNVNGQDYLEIGNYGNSLAGQGYTQISAQDYAKMAQEQLSSGYCRNFRLYWTDIPQKEYTVNTD